jgi:hypothetical protein
MAHADERNFVSFFDCLTVIQDPKTRSPNRSDSFSVQLRIHFSKSLLKRREFGLKTLKTIKMASAGRHLIVEPEAEDFSFEELQSELEKLQHQLQEHGRSLFGGELPNHSRNPVVVEIPRAVSSSPQPQSLSHHQEIVIEDIDEDVLSLEWHKTHNSSKKVSKNERNLKLENQNLKRKLAEEREELHRLRALKSVSEEKMASRLAQLEERLKLLQQNEKKLEKRRAADAEGWRAEFSALRHRLQSAEHRQRKLIVVSSIRDEDHREKVVARHNKLENIQQHKGEGSTSAPGKNTLRKGEKPSSSAFGGGRHDEEVQKQKKDKDEFDQLTEEGLQECMEQLTEELNALKSALGNLEQQFYR